jgi:hypothetical protein
MIDPQAPVPLDTELGVLAFADHQDPDAVWVLPAKPRLSRSDGGAPQASLLVYKRAGQRSVFGAMASLTVDLHLSAAELAAVAAALEARRDPPPPGSPAPPPISVAVPPWLSGEVRVDLAEGISASGTPSLLHDNACSVTFQPDAEHAATLADAWDAGLPDATVSYEVTVEAAQWGAADVTVASYAQTYAAQTYAGGASEAAPSGRGASDVDAAGDADAASMPAAPGPDQHPPGPDQRLPGPDQRPPEPERSTTQMTSARLLGAVTRSVPHRFTLSGPIRLDTAERAATRTDIEL